MTSLSPIPWSVDDVLNYKESPEFPWISYEAGSDEAIAAGAGIWQSALFKEYGGWTKSNLNGSDINFASASLYQDLVQFILANGGGSLPLLTDNIYCFPEENKASCNDLGKAKNGWVTLNDYMKSMWKKPSTEYTEPNTFDIDRFMLRTIPPPKSWNNTSEAFTGTGLTLPTFTNKFYKPKIWRCWPVMPPLGYCNIGAWVEFYQIGTSPTRLLFCMQDPRFVQPPVWGAYWDFSWYNFLGTTAAVSCTYTSMSGKKATGTFRFSYSPFGYYLPANINFELKKGAVASYDSYAKCLPWLFNNQLFRSFPNAPPYGNTNFTPSSINRVVAGSFNTNPAAHAILSTPQFHATMCCVNPSSGSACPIPLYLPMSVRDLIECCTGRFNFQSYYWKWTDFERPPALKDASDTLPLSAAICQSGGWSFDYNPSGLDCQYIGTGFCNPDSPFAKSFKDNPDETPSCACLNLDYFIELTLGPSPLPDAYKQTAEFLRANIQCVYAECASKPNALKNKDAPPLARKCPNLTTCVISNVVINSNSPATIYNQCGNDVNQGPGDDGTGTTPGQQPGGSLGTAAIIVPIVGGVFLILGICFAVAIAKGRNRSARNQILRASKGHWKPSRATDADDVLTRGSDDESY